MLVSMRWNLHRVGAAVLGLALCTSAAAQDRGYWRAASKNASTITGDFALGDTRLTLNFYSFPVAPIRRLSTTEVAAAFDVDLNSGANGQLYRLRIAAGQQFMHKNTLCGSDDTQWMATFVEGRNLHVAFFSGDSQPVLTMQAILDSTDLCGIFVYAR